MESFELMPTEENLILALKEDILNRNKDIVYFNNLLLAQSSASAIAIDGRWGSGKTFFIKQTRLVIDALNPVSDMNNEKRTQITCKLQLNKDVQQENYNLAVYYDAWENDNDTEPILSIVYEITKQLSITYNFEDKNIFKLAGSIVEIISGRNVSGIIDNLLADDPLSKFKEQKDLEEKIKTFLGEILIERGNRLIVFIDELDRCKPSFAVHLLEQIKHYLCDNRITFVFSVNIEELQHTIKHYYGVSFDACRYLDRFFDIRIDIPPAHKDSFYNKLGLNSSYVVERVSKRIIEMYHFELREVTRFYRQVKTAIFEPTHDSKKFEFDFPDGKGRQIILIYIVPLLIGLKIVDISLYYQFINGDNNKPLKDLFDTEDMEFYVLEHMLNNDETFSESKDKIIVTREEIICRLYKAVFINKYEGRKYREIIGEYEFDSRSKEFAISTASMMSNYVDYFI